MRRTTTAVLAAALAAGLAAAGAAGGATHEGVAYRGSLAASDARPVALPAAPGQKAQHDFEAQAQAAPDGTVWATANIPSVPAGGTDLHGTDTRGTKLISGVDVWVSRDGGRAFHWVAAPFNPVPGGPGFAGDDADITVAPARNAGGHYTVSVVSLNLVASQLAWSPDDGATWQVLPIVGVPVQDRPWVAADGPCLVHVSSRQTGSSEPVLETVDTCTGLPVSSAPLVPVADTAHESAMVLTLNLLSRPTADNGARSPYRSSLYVPMTQCTVPADVVAYATGPTGCTGGARVEHLLGISRDQGKTFTLHRVTLQAIQRYGIAIWAMSVATDDRGRVYVVWHDSHDAWLQVSRDGGVTFSRPQRLNAGLGAAVYPTVAARGDGQVAIAAFVADRTGDVNDLKTFGDPLTGGPGRASWRLEMWRSSDAARTFRRAPRSGVVHRGVVCTSGGACTMSNGDRTLFDDFGLVLLPDGSAVAVLDANGANATVRGVSTVSVRLPAS